MTYNRKKYIDDSSSSTISYDTIIERERERKPKTKKRSSGAFDLAKILFSTISKSKGSKKDKSSTNKESDKNKSSSKSEKNSKKSSSIKHRR